MIGTKKAPEGAFGMLHIACWLGAQRSVQRYAVITPHQPIADGQLKPSKKRRITGCVSGA